MENALQNRKILVVDDESELRENLALYLSKCGAEVLEASNGAEALQIVLGQTVHAILSDVRMPVMSGDKLLDQIKRRNAFEPVVILMTGYSAMSTDEALHRGAEAIFRKPFRMQDVVQALVTALRRMDAAVGRKLPRYAATEKVNIILDEGKREIVCRTFNIGRGGLFIQTEDPIPVGSQCGFVLEVKLEDTRECQIKGDGVSRWVRYEDIHGLPQGFGLEFQMIVEEDYPLFLSLLKNYEKNEISFIPKG